jgi:hypothetical protein
MSGIVMSLEMLNYLRGQQGLPPVIPEAPVYPKKLEEIKADLLARFDIEAQYVKYEDSWTLEWFSCTDFCDGFYCYTELELGEDDIAICIERKNNFHWDLNKEFETFEEFDEFWKSYNPVYDHIEED